MPGYSEFCDAIWRNRGAYSRASQGIVYFALQITIRRGLREILKVDQKLPRHDVGTRRYSHVH